MCYIVQNGSTLQSTAVYRGSKLASLIKCMCQLETQWHLAKGRQDVSESEFDQYKTGICLEFGSMDLQLFDIHFRILTLRTIYKVPTDNLC